jgi:23S rRNA (cytosine1962-C5)-methyltransferase
VFETTQYQLLDFGAGRRLERFGEVLLDRPCPAAELLPQAAPELWAAADARFQRLEADEGQWTLQGNPPRNWTVAYRMSRVPPPSGAGSDHPASDGLPASDLAAGLTFALKRTDFGHVGLFPEQAENWEWIADQVRRSSAASNAWKILNLFAYTGGSTLAAAAAGARVTHVDAARNIIAWARQNAELSGLAAAPIRWICEDAVKFVEREVRRGNLYDAVILDPPSYGHGPHGEVWRMAEDLPRLLELCSALTPRPRFVLLSCHTPGFTAERVRELLAAAFGPLHGGCDAFPLTLTASTGKMLPSGVAGRWTR